ncbi:MAG: GAF domain-containing protein [Candidatus Omnitrophota bacterium]
MMTLSGEDALVRALMSKRCPLIYDEFQSAVEAIPVGIDENAVPQIQKLRGNVIVPIANDAALLGFIVLGDLKGKETYSLELLGALNVLGNQAALAITNCYFLEEEARRMEEAGLQERRISLDHIASSMAHEIDNPMSVICGQVEVLRETLEDVRIIMPEEMTFFRLDAPVIVFKGVWHGVISLTPETELKITENLNVSSRVHKLGKRIGVSDK